MDAAERVADRWRADPRLRRLCQTVIPVAGLLAQAGTSLREDEFLTLRNLASVPVEELEAVLLSADRVRSRRLSVDVDDEERRQLLERLGLLGIRLSVGWIRSGRVTASPDLARALVEASGLGQLREALARQFEFRSQVLKARSGLVAADVALAEETSAPARQLRLQLQRIQHGAHEIVEIDLLNRLRSDVVDIPADYAIDMERLLGGAGPSAAERLGLVQGTANAELDAGAADAISRYRRLAVHPLASRTLTDLADAVVRSCEGLLADLRQSPG